jgi:hypothetical protein
MRMNVLKEKEIKVMVFFFGNNGELVSTEYDGYRIQFTMKKKEIYFMQK